MDISTGLVARPRMLWIGSRVTPWLIAAVFLALAIRLLWFVNRYTVNILFWDQWDFLAGLFAGVDPWTLFRWQHGPQRQGLGNLLTSAIYGATGWNARVDAAASAVVIVLAGAAALWLVKRVSGSLRPWDVVVPLIFLTTTNAETYVVAPNLAHGPLPLLLLMGYALALTADSHAVRCAALVVVNFFAVNTGFTLLLGGVTPFLLLVLATAPGLSGREQAMYGGAIAASLGTVGLFLGGFVPASATDCFQFPHDRPWDYVSYAGFVLARPFGFIAGVTTAQLWVAGAIAIGMAAFVAYVTFRMLGAKAMSKLWLVASFLGGFTLLFAATSAVGRICLGFDSANATRYIPYVMPGMLAMYLVVRTTAQASPIAHALLPVFLVACILKENDELSRNEANDYFRYKQRWRDCYLSMHDIDACDAWSGHAVYPLPNATDLQGKLDWLEERRLSFFRDRERLTSGFR
jgi:hypothetical protein